MKHSHATVRAATLRRDYFARPFAACQFSRFVLAMLTALFALWLVSLARAEAAPPDMHEWTNWRGPSGDNTSGATNLPAEFDPKGGEGSNVLWKSEALATRSTPIVMNGKLYTLARHNPGTPTEGEKVVCADPATGEILWENTFNVYLSDVPDTRVAWSNLVGDPETGRIYALGVCGLFQCIDGETGKTVWSRSLTEECGLLTTYGGRTNTPVLHDDLVIISGVVIGWGEKAKPAHRFLGLDKEDGTIVWFNGTTPLPNDTTYSTPSLAVIDGQWQMIFGSGDGDVWSLQPRTGQPIWHYNLSMRGLNVPPLVRGNMVYTGHSEENLGDTTRMGKLLALDATTAGERDPETGVRDLTQSGAVWAHPEIMVGRSGPVMVGDQLVVIEDSATLLVYDSKTGEQSGRQKLGTMMRGTPLVADGKLYVFPVNGRGYILEVKDGEVEIVHRVRFPRGYTSHGSPICAGGRIYVPTTGAMYCIGFEDWKPNEIEPPQPAPEAPVEEDQEPVHVQVVPAEALVAPGEALQLTVRLFNAHGQLLGEQPAEFTVDGPGQVSAEGQFTAEADAGHTAATVTAKVGELEGVANIRIMPPLPWKFDFTAGEVPLPWIGIRYRHVVRELDGEPVMVKVSTIPKGTRSQGWFGPTDLSDYTVAADVRGAGDGVRLPDIGLSAQRYCLIMNGASQSLEIRSWHAVKRMAEEVDFAWEPDTWYRMKFSATVESTPEGDVAVLRGKVWPKGEAEPEAWTIEARDKAPNRRGAPGLFADATSAEAYYDNLEVSKNP